MTITTLRPSGVSSSAGWSAVPSGTLAAVTSDDSDSTYALWSGTGAGMVLTTPLDAPPTDERRHQVRVRLRGQSGDAWWAAILSNGAIIAPSSGTFDATPETITGSWGFGAPREGATTISAYVTAQEGSLRAVEVYIDVDSRLPPDFTPQVLNGAGASTTTVSDTATPRMRVSAPDYDDLNPSSYRYWVTRAGAVVWDSGEVSGPPADLETTPLDNGSYTAHLQIWTTIGANHAYGSGVKTVDFTVSVGAVPQPDNPNVTPLTGTPFYQISACAPDVSAFDDAVGWIEVERVDCPEGGYLRLPGSEGAFAETPDNFHIFNDLQITFHGQRDDGWRPTTDDTLAAHWDETSGSRGWKLYMDADGEGDPAVAGRFVFAWTEDGVSTTTVVADRRVPVDPYGRASVRMLLDSDDGAGQWRVTWLTEIDGEWVEFATPVSYGTGTTTIFPPGVPYAVGTFLDAGDDEFRFTGRVYSLEVRDGATGPVIVSPDFTGHMAGTDEVTDAQGNVWEIHAPAAITSDQRITSLTVLGPLTSEECATWTDYSLPRTGVAVTCEHQPEPCCSYYRSRTVVRDNGSIQISDWSSVFNPGMPEGLIVMWPLAAATIPEGWNRTTALDGRYPKGIATTGTEPGQTGGAATHTHTLPTHVHGISHSHVIAGNTGAAVGTVSSDDGNPGSTAISGGHTHAMPLATGNTVLDSEPTAPDTYFVGNDPDRLDVVFIESDGNPLGVPAAALALMGDIAPAGWSTYADATNRFLKGSAPGADGGVAVAGTLDGHTHTVLDHSHAGTSHFHTGGTTGVANSALSLYAGPTNVMWTSQHDHPVSIANANTAPLAMGGQAESGGSAGNNPPYRNVRVRQNTSGDVSLPVGLICAWRGSLGSIPDHWQLADGTNGTIDLTARYPRGATSSIGGTGGSLDPHTHTGISHTHTTSGHSHQTTVGVSDDGTANVSSTSRVTVARGNHTHASVDTASSTPTVGSAATGTLQATTAEPLHEQVAFVQLIEEPTPPAAPAVFCLTWSDDEHLIRSEGPDGPLWAPARGKIAWDRARPFTAAKGVNGTTFVTSAPPGGRNLHMTLAVESEAELAQLREVLARPLVLVSPSDSAEVWAAPVAESVRVVKVGRIRQVTADFIGTGPQPVPSLADMVAP